MDHDCPDGSFYCRECGGRFCEHQACPCFEITCPACGHTFEKGEE